MTRLALAAAVLCLAACSSAADEAEAQYNIVANSGSLGEKCTAAQRVRDAHLSAHDTVNYSVWQSRAQVDCNEAAFEGSSMPADPAIRAKANAEVDSLEANLANSN